MAQTDQVISCPGGWRVTGGGHRGSKSLTPNSGFPTGTAFDQWAFFIDNHTNVPLPFTGFAVCVRIATEFVTESDPDTPAGAQTFVEAACPAGRFVAGGGTSNGGGFDEIGINSIFPGGFAGAPNASWSVWTDNRSADQRSVSSRAVCVPSLR